MRDATSYAPHGIPAAHGAEWIHYNLGPGHSHSPLNVGTNPDATIQAYLNWGRWVVDCPDCRNAQLACRTDPRFMCNECGNVASGKLWRPVEWPPNVQAIETLLQNRPVENQNWTPSESRVGLAIENLTHTGRIK